jgi:hypothetical protein
MPIFQRGKFYPQLTNLVRINTPKAVQTDTRKAFKKLPALDSAVAALTSLKGVGTTLASGFSHLSPPSPCLLFFYFKILQCFESAFSVDGAGSVLRIRDVYPGSRVKNISDPGSGSASKNSSIFNPKNCF